MGTFRNGELAHESIGLRVDLESFRSPLRKALGQDTQPVWESKASFRGHRGPSRQGQCAAARRGEGNSISTPIRRTRFGCCALAASGHAMLMLPRRVMNSRRRISTIICYLQLLPHSVRCGASLAGYAPSDATASFVEDTRLRTRCRGSAR
jgi:hypothetical protein